MVRPCLVVLALAVSVPAWGQQLTLQIQDGLVTLSAENASVSQVLAAWARVGGTRVVGAERISGPTLTVHLEGVSETEALAIILRDAAGYVAAVRSSTGSGGSMFDRILVLATSTPPTAPAAAMAAASLPAARMAAVPAADEPAAQADAPLDAPEISEPWQTNPFAQPFGGGPTTTMTLDAPGQAIPFGPPVPRPGQPLVQDASFFKQLPPADDYDPSLPGLQRPPRR